MHHAMTRAVRVTYLCLAAPAVLAAAVVQAQDPAALRAATLAAGCAACHGTAGHAVAHATLPGLAGMSADRLRDAMKAFRSDQRAGSVMPQLAKGYSDEQIDRLAVYFAAQAVSP